jgi:hypothetical protein
VDLYELGELLAELPPIVELETSVSEYPPSGAGELVRLNGDKFEWRPLATADWKALPPTERARIVVARGIAWLEQNADLAVPPVVFVNKADESESTEYLFGELGSTLREAICGTHRLIRSNPTAAQCALLALSAVIFTVTGIHAPGTPMPDVTGQVLDHFPTISPHVAEALIVAYAERFCS